MRARLASTRQRIVRSRETNLSVSRASSPPHRTRHTTEPGAYVSESIMLSLACKPVLHITNGPSWRNVSPSEEQQRQAQQNATKWRRELKMEKKTSQEKVKGTVLEKKKPKSQLEILNELRQENIDLKKDKKKGNKALDKAKEVKAKTSPAAIKKAIAEQKARNKAEIASLRAENKAMASGNKVTGKQVEVIRKESTKALQELDEIHGMSGLHKNSPKKLARDPFSYAVPFSIIGTCESMFPNNWKKHFKPNTNRPYAIESIDGKVLFNFSNWLMLEVTANGHTFRRDYSQGLTPYVKKILTDCMAKAA